MQRAQIILRCAEGLSGVAISKELDTEQNTVSKWINRWIESELKRSRDDPSADSNVQEKRRSSDWPGALRDAQRSGAPLKFAPEQFVSIVALACKEPSQCGREISNWTHRELRDESMKQEIVEQISERHIGRILSEASLQPHRNRYWLNGKEDPDKRRRIADICACYRQAQEAPTEAVYYSIDEMTGVQALERIANDIAMKARQPRPTQACRIRIPPTRNHLPHGSTECDHWSGQRMVQSNAH